MKTLMLAAALVVGVATAAPAQDDQLTNFYWISAMENSYIQGCMAVQMPHCASNITCKAEAYGVCTLHAKDYIVHIVDRITQ